MHTTPHPLPLARRARPLVRTLALAAGLTAGAVGVTATPAMAADEAPAFRRLARLCDPSACYVAWRVVDSDGDGVTDADELTAGTDPHDARSVPGLPHLLELQQGRGLPSFEHGLAAFVVLPAELQAEVLAGTGLEGLQTAFPLGKERGDALSRAGISAEQLAEHGIDLERDGFTLGLGPAAKGESAPPLRLGRLDRSTYGADSGESLSGLGGHTGATPVSETAIHGGTATYFDNGTYREDRDDGSGGQITKDDDLITWGPSTSGHGDSEGDHGRTDPDAEGTTAPSEEQLAAWARFQDAAVRTAEGRPKPAKGDLEDAEGRRNPLILTDDTVPGAYALVLDAPRITTAQPEVAPGFHDPTVPAGGFGSGCKGRC